LHTIFFISDDVYRDDSMIKAFLEPCMAAASKAHVFVPSKFYKVGYNTMSTTCCTTKSYKVCMVKSCVAS
jgi:hypothetical protein